MWEDLRSIKTNEVKTFDWEGKKELFQELQKKKQFNTTEERFHRNLYISLHSFSGTRDGGYGRKNANRGKRFFDNMNLLQSHVKDVKIYNSDYKEIVRRYDSNGQSYKCRNRVVMSLQT